MAGGAGYAALLFAVLCCRAADGYTGTRTPGVKNTQTSLLFNSAGFTYVGCYNENPNDRDLPHKARDCGEDPSCNMTPQLCNGICAGYHYFAVSITACYCGNEYGKHGKAQSQWTGEKNQDNLDQKPGCYHECYGTNVNVDLTATEGQEQLMHGGYECGGVNRNSVYNRPEHMSSDCGTSGEEKTLNIRATHICQPPQGALTAAAQPPGQSHVSLEHHEATYTYPGALEHDEISPNSSPHHTFNDGGTDSDGSRLFKDAYH